MRSQENSKIKQHAPCGCSCSSLLEKRQTQGPFTEQLGRPISISSNLAPRGYTFDDQGAVVGDALWTGGGGTCDVHAGWRNKVSIYSQPKACLWADRGGRGGWREGCLGSGMGAHVFIDVSMSEARFAWDPWHVADSRAAHGCEQDGLPSRSRGDTRSVSWCGFSLALGFPPATVCWRC